MCVGGGMWWVFQPSLRDIAWECDMVEDYKGNWPTAMTAEEITKCKTIQAKYDTKRDADNLRELKDHLKSW